ncbi:MAG: hypothetical protein WD176_01695, partial [Pirellulales bacterium]
WRSAAPALMPAAHTNTPATMTIGFMDVTPLGGRSGAVAAWRRSGAIDVHRARAFALAPTHSGGRQRGRHWP